MTYPLVRKVRIEPPGSWRGWDLDELWRYRELLYFLVWRDTKVRYKQTVLGALWAVIQPVATTVIFTIFFGHLGGLAEKVDEPYPLFVYVGLSLWTFFANAVSTAANSLVGSSHLISKVYFPRLLVPIASIMVGLIDFAIAFAFLMLLLVFYGVPVSWQVVWFPVFVAGTIVCAIGVGVMLSALVVTYRDVRFVLVFAIQLWLFATPVLYGLNIIPPQWRLVYALNPMVGMISGARAAVFGDPFPVGEIVVSIAATLVVLIAGVSYFSRVERRFADVI